MMALQRRLTQLIDSERGSVTIMVCGALVLLVIVVGAAVDMAREQLLQTRISSALDSAGLAAAMLGNNNQAQVQAEATKYFNLNYPQGYLGSDPITVNATLNSSIPSVHLTASTTLATSFMNVAGINSLPVNVISDVKIGQTSCAVQNVYVADTNSNGGIKVYDKSGNSQGVINGASFATGQLNSPYDVHADNNGNLWVTDHSNYRVVEFSNTGNFITSFVGSPTAFSTPDSVTVDSAGQIFVTDLTNNNFQVYNNGNPPTYAGVTGGGGQLSAPAGITLDASGNLWIADGGNGRFIQYAPNGTATGNQIGTNGQFNKNWGVTVDKFGNIWGTEGGAGNFYKFSGSPPYTQLIKKSGYIHPIGITADGCGDIWVTDQDQSAGNSVLYQFDNNGNQLQSIAMTGTEPAGVTTILSSSGTPGIVYIDQ